MIEAFPLQGPPTIPRSKTRETGKFKTTLAGALKNVQESLRRFGADSGQAIKDLVLSSNCSLGVEKPADPGVAAWFTWDGSQVCIPVDRYSTPAANLQAIHHIIEARRVELRHGTLALVRATFAGFKALPAPGTTREWWEVLGVPRTASLAEARAVYRRAAAAAHPDRGGDDARMSALNAAWAKAQESAR
jgi:hypothetical protein